MPRFRIRSLMIVVALSACLVWAGITGKQLRTKSRRYRALATQHAASEAGARAAVKRMVALLSTLEADIAKKKEKDEPEVLQLMLAARSDVTEEMRREKLKLDRESTLRRSYSRVARHPWLPAPTMPE